MLNEKKVARRGVFDTGSKKATTTSREEKEQQAPTTDVGWKFFEAPCNGTNGLLIDGHVSQRERDRRAVFRAASPRTRNRDSLREGPSSALRVATASQTRRPLTCCSTPSRATWPTLIALPMAAARRLRGARCCWIQGRSKSAGEERERERKKMVPTVHQRNEPEKGAAEKQKSKGEASQTAGGFRVRGPSTMLSSKMEK